MPLLPAFLARLIDKSCAIPMSGSQVTSCHEHTPAHRLSAWAARGLASHNELPKTLRTMPTYIVYDNVTQCFGHEPLSGAMRFSEKPTIQLHRLRTEGPSISRLQGNVSGRCRLLGALYRSLAFEYFTRRLISSVCPDSARKRSPTFWHQVNVGGFFHPMADAPVAMNRDRNPLAR